VGLANLVIESEKCVGSRVHLVGVSISFENNFYRLPFTPPSLVRRIGPSPLVQDPPTSLEASLPVLPRKPRNVARKRVAKKLKVTETTSQEASFMSSVVEYLFLDVVYANNEIPLLAGDSTFRPRRARGRRRLGYGGRAGWSQPQPSPHRRRTCGAIDAPAPVAAGSTEPAVAVAEEPTATEDQEEAPAEAGLVDITSILGAPTVTVVRSSL
jgi:hypothetical protein